MVIYNIYNENEHNTHVMFLLHGYSCDADSMKHYIDMFKERLPNSFNMKFICPEAPVRNVSCYSEKAPAWYNYYTDLCYKEERINYNHSRKITEKLKDRVDREAKKLSNNYNHIYILGESQGACQALDLGLSIPQKLGGIMSFRGHLLRQTPLKNKQTIWSSHGKLDDAIGFGVAQNSYKKLINNDYDFYFHHENVLDHYEYSEKEIKSCIYWIKSNCAQSMLK
jgi:predicted esterase